MRKLLPFTLVGSLLLACVGLISAGGDEARAIVKKSIDAIGGEKAVIKHKAHTFTSKGTYHGMGNGLPYTGEYAVEWPDKFRMEIQGAFLIVFNGDKGWTKTAANIKEMDAEQLATQRHDHKASWMSSLLPLMDKEFELKIFAEGKVGDRPTRVVRATRKDYPDVRFHFDKDNHLLLKMEYRTKAAEQGYQEVDYDIVFSDYKEVDGLKTPHTTVMRRDGKLYIESELVTMKSHGTLDPALFAKPE
jgi:hypothetical protein